MKDRILTILEESIQTKKNFFSSHIYQIEQGTRMLADAFQKGGRLLIFGNGGSAADAQHMAAEFVNRFQMERRPLPALALTTDTSVITSIGNDYSFDEIFAKQIQAFGRAGDIALGISTSGNSPNVIRAMTEAGSMGLTRIGLSGRGGKLKDISTLCFCVDSTVTARIQETHITLVHVLCDLTERILFS